MFFGDFLRKYDEAITKFYSENKWTIRKPKNIKLNGGKVAVSTYVGICV